MALLPDFPCPGKLPQPPQRLNVAITTFCMDDCTDISVIGSGTFGVVCRCRYRGAFCVLKQLHDVDDEEDEPHHDALYRKEVQLLDRLRGHPNVVNILAYCYPRRALMLEFMSFTFQCIGMSVNPVNSLDRLIRALARNNFNGCTHVPAAVAMDVATGLNFLHSRGVVHRDLKPANVLVSNDHYCHLERADVCKWWATRPVVCKLTDFGESRSAAVKTRIQMTSTMTRNLERGSPVYQAPEIYVDAPAAVHVPALKMMDIWSFAMVVFDLLNPDTFVYRAEVIDAGALDRPNTVLMARHKDRLLPQFSDVFRPLQQTVWQPLRTVFDACATYMPRKRPAAKEVLACVVNAHVWVQCLPVSQTNLGSFGPGRNKRKRLDRTRNACSFLAILLADKLLRSERASGSSTQQHLATLATDAILNFPDEVHQRRTSDQLYGIQEAYDVMRAAEACSEYSVDLRVFSQTPKDSTTAMDELRMALHTLMGTGDCFAAVYVVPPVSVLVCSVDRDSLCVVDTHAVPKRCGGDDVHGAVVMSRDSVTAIPSITNWLLNRTNRERLVTHELGLLSPVVSSLDIGLNTATGASVPRAASTASGVPSRSSAGTVNASVDGWPGCTMLTSSVELALLVPEHDAAVGYSGSASADEQTVTVVENTSKPSQTVSIFTDRALAAGIQPTSLTEFPHCRKWAQTARPPADVRPIAIVRPTSSFPCRLKSLNADASGCSSAQHHCSPPELPSVVSGAEALSCSTEPYVMSSTEELVIHVPSDSDDTNMEWELFSESPAQVPLDQNSLQDSSANPCRLTEEQVEGTQAEDHMNLWMSCSPVEDEVRYLNISQNNG